MPTISEKARAFRALHEGTEAFAIPNPWDRGSALLLQGLGFEALATTSLGLANMMGKKRATLQEVLDNCRVIAEATDLPVNVDLENCFADDPAEAAKAIALAQEYGAVGGSIEDSSGDPSSPIYALSLAVERVQAAVETARSLPVPFMLTARAENFLHGRRDLDDTIRRLQAFEQAGADVLYAPGLHTLEEIRTVVGAVKRPFNVVMGFADPSITMKQLSEAGVRRVSIGGGLSRIALQSFLTAATEMREGRFDFVAGLKPLGELQRHFD
ncbi:MAG: isocitrate lyase/phosphoenolpyruvate mutase family protein [Phreatobacter sp.]|uniref:isocitrate lyase/PEP mutase family protein n=1 Tax=Phreatobacter sp. TaxID=1966341 RepID=UPI001A472315|nr:isocitrate lyase/phosphoenolpyruvate mutase family protein [Phreatobacter sp.]MBL8568559.1 isocitrate lyase/phosphoenolpyruvate mutase family protein [Phreatobacter sp.]